MGGLTGLDTREDELGGREARMTAPELPSSFGERSPAPQFSVETISELQSFLRLEKAWNDLVEEAGVEHPFLSHEWVRTGLNLRF